jgi:hypothetical protein
VVGRASALLVLFAALVVYYETTSSLWQWGVWGDVAWITCVLIPAVFALALLALPLRNVRLLIPLAVGFVVLAVVLTWIDNDLWSNFARFAAATLVGWAFLLVFEAVSWVALVAAIIPFVDSVSVWRGPTKTITTKHPKVFDVLSFAFPSPGGHSGGQLGMPDVLFFSLFLGACARFHLRVAWTFVGMVVGLGLTFAATTEFQTLGLPALPGIALGFLVPNADLLWRAIRRPAEVSDTLGV